MDHSARRITGRKAFIFLMTGMMMGCAGGERKNQKDVFGFIQKIQDSYVSGKDAIAQAIPAQLKMIAQKDDVSLFEANAFRLNNSITVDNVDLRLRGDESTPYFVAFDLSGSCITSGAVQQQYPNLTLTERARSYSFNDISYYTTKKDNNNISVSFGFTASALDCLRTVAFIK